MFGPKCVSEIKEQVGQLLESYQSAIDAAYARTPKALKVGFSVTLSPGTAGGIDIKTSMSLVVERIKDSTHGTADERQMRIQEA